VDGQFTRVLVSAEPTGVLAARMRVRRAAYPKRWAGVKKGRMRREAAARYLPASHGIEADAVIG
jgi:hypothetical protein